jgi:hypothetical protein
MLFELSIGQRHQRGAHDFDCIVIVFVVNHLNPTRFTLGNRSHRKRLPFNPSMLECRKSARPQQYCGKDDHNQNETRTEHKAHVARTRPGARFGRG